MLDAFVNSHGMAKQKFRPTRLGVFSGAKAYIRYVEVLKKRHNAVGRTFCDAINAWMTYFQEEACNAAEP
jgi:putative protease